MNIREICRRGYFDKVIIDYRVNPIFTNQIEICNNMSFNESVDNTFGYIDTSIFKVRINIIGVDCNKVYFDKAEDINRYRDNHMRSISSVYKGLKSFIVAYADIIIVKDEDRENTEIVTGEQDIDFMLDSAFSIQSKHKKDTKNNIIIVDKVYVYEHFRKCGISKWLHNNIRDIVNGYSGIEIGDILLIPGDFSNEAELRFNMNHCEYIDMLRKHYESVGYKLQGNNLMCNRLKTRKLSSLLHIDIIKKS